MSGRIRSSQRGCAQAADPSSRSSTGISTSRIRAASSRTATPRITPISFGGSGPESARKLGLDTETLGEVLAITALFNSTNALADGYQIEPDVLPPVE